MRVERTIKARDRTSSARSSDLLCEWLHGRATVMVAEPPLELVAAELARRLGHGPFAVHPLGLDRVQPRAPARQAADQQAADQQAADQQAAAASGGLDPPVVVLDPGAHLPADV